MWKFAASLAVVLLSACSSTVTRNETQPPVAAFYGSAPGETVQVQVQIAPTADPTTAHARTQITANRVCGRRNMRAEYTQRRVMLNRNWEDIYMCR